MSTSSYKEGFADLYPRVSDAFEGKSILITGVTGFLGTILLEILLRTCPGIVRIYILLRAKKGLTYEERKEKLLNKEIFDYIKQTMPDVLKKVDPIEGDCRMDNLGMSEYNAKEVAQNATIVYHVGSNTDLVKPLDFMLKENLIGTDNIIEFCKKCKKIDALIYTSTAFSNSYIMDEPIKEIVYPLPDKAESIIEDIRNAKDAEYLQTKISQWNLDFKNTYVVSKNMSEKLLEEKASDLPVSIIRPSVIMSCWKGPIPGYVEEHNGIILMCMAAYRGFMRVVLCDPDIHFDTIPVDIVANAHIVATWCHIAKRCSSPIIVNCTYTGKGFTWRNLRDNCLKAEALYPAPKAYLKPSVFLTKSEFLFWLVSLVEHYIPAYVFDLFLAIGKKKIRLVKLYKFYTIMTEATKHFQLHQWEYRRENFDKLASFLQPYDEKLFYLKTDSFDLDEAVRNSLQKAPFMNWKTDNLTPEQRKRRVYYTTLIANMIKLTSVSFILFVLILFFKKTSDIFFAKL